MLKIKDHSEEQIAIEVCTTIKKLLEENDFCIEIDRAISIPNTSRFFRPDITILTKENNIYAIIEIGKNHGGSFFKEKIEHLKNLTKTLCAPFFIFSDGTLIDLYDVKEDKNNQLRNFNELKDILLEKDLDVASGLYNSFTKSIDEAINNLKNNDENKISYTKLSKIKELVTNDFFVIDKSDLCFKEETEKDLIKTLFEFTGPDKEICRYTSLKSLFDMLDYSSLRMFGIAGMNDKTEVNYVERCIFKEKKPLVSSVNNHFITSCSTKVDDLTLFRLYGDDAKGVCLIFEVRENPDFKLKNICYMEENNPVFVFLNKFISKTQTVSHRKFVLKTLNDWSHFIKPTEYESEEEIRLMYVSGNRIKPDGWILSQPHNIVNPYKDFSLLNSSFPLKLKKVILGPKCSELEINSFQIDAMLKDKGFTNVIVSQSEIDSYR